VSIRILSGHRRSRRSRVIATNSPTTEGCDLAAHPPGIAFTGAAPDISDDAITVAAAAAAGGAGGTRTLQETVARPGSRRRADGLSAIRQLIADANEVARCVLEPPTAVA
jgi:hypothetical protein